jgi:cell division protein ZapA
VAAPARPDDPLVAFVCHVESVAKKRAATPEMANAGRATGWMAILQRTGCSAGRGSLGVRTGPAIGIPSCLNPRRRQAGVARLGFGDAALDEHSTQAKSAVGLAPMDRRTVDLRIAGQNYRVMSSAPEEELRRLAGMVDSKVSELTARGRSQAAQAVLLAAIALAHEVEAERERRESLERKTRDLLRKVLVRIDDALEGGDPDEAARAD